MATNPQFDPTQKFVGITATSSVDLVRQVLRLQAEGCVVAIIKDQPSAEQAIGGAFDLARIIDPLSDHGWSDFTIEPIAGERIAQVFFTSGTEGHPKAVLVSASALSNTSSRLIEVMNIDASIREYVGVPVFHSFGFGRCRAVLSAGGKFFIPQNGFDLQEFLSLSKGGTVNALSVVPSLARLILEHSERVIGNVDAIKWIEIGSQYMSADEKKNFLALFPNATIIQHYGLTEASRTTFLDIGNTPSRYLESVGKPVGGVETGIAGDKISIRGPHLASYKIDQGRIAPLAGDDGWFTTSDLGRMDEGYLFFNGRADDLINCTGVKIPPHAVEAALCEKFPGTPIAVARIPDAMRGDGVFIAIEGNVPPADFETIIDMADSALNDLGLNARSAIKVQTVHKLPRTANGKIIRKEVSELYAPAPEVARSVSADASTVLDVFRQTFPGRDISSSDSFTSLGGDSLNFVRTILMLEDVIGTPPDGWERMPISALGNIEKKGSKFFEPVESIVAFRALAISGVVASHAKLIDLSGSAAALLMLVGYSLARFQSPHLCENIVWPTIARYLRKIVIPGTIITLSYFAWKQTFELDGLLMISNWFRVHGTFIFPAWFIQVLVQCVIIVGLLFSLKPVRQFAKASPFEFALAFLVAATVLRVSVSMAWDTNYLYRRLPHFYLCILATGWLIYEARAALTHNIAKRLIATASLGLFFTMTLPLSTLVILVAIGTYVCWIDRTPAPRGLRGPIQLIGSAIFYIYLLHMAVLHVTGNILGLTNPALKFVLAMAGSIAIWIAFEGPDWAVQYRKSALTKLAQLVGRKNA